MDKSYQIYIKLSTASVIKTLKIEPNIIIVKLRLCLQFLIRPYIILPLLILFKKEYSLLKIAPVVILLGVFGLLLCSCGTSASSTTPAATVETYIQALVGRDRNHLSALSCADWAPTALQEMDSFQAVQTRLEGLSCQVSGTDGATTLVKCQGKIIATYNGEDQTLDLSARTYQVVHQGGDYVVCGFR